MGKNVSERGKSIEKMQLHNFSVLRSWIYSVIYHALNALRPGNIFIWFFFFFVVNWKFNYCTRSSSPHHTRTHLKIHKQTWLERNDSLRNFIFDGQRQRSSITVARELKCRVSASVPASMKKKTIHWSENYASCNGSCRTAAAAAFERQIELAWKFTLRKWDTNRYRTFKISAELSSSPRDRDVIIFTTIIQWKRHWCKNEF